MVANRISKILIVDDHIIVKTGVEFLLRKINPAIESFHAADFEEALALIRKIHFDLIILDIDIPGGNNVGMIDTIRIKDPDVAILIFTGYSERIYAIPYLRSGANGFLSKDASEQELEKAISCIERGKKYISADLQQVMLDSIVFNEAKDVDSLSRLSKREMDVASLLVKGNSTAQIAQILNLQLSTVSTFKSRIFAKMEVTNLVELIAKMKLAL